MNPSIRREILGAATALVLCVLSLRALLIDGTGILPHDNYYWCYPIFHFFSEAITQGRLPLWNPFVHGGEPFYPLLGQIRLLDPIALLTPLVAQFFTLDTVLWFNWTRFLQAVVMNAGVYLLLRPLARLPWVRLCLMAVLLFSSPLLGTFPQDGILAAFAWVPYLLWFGLRLVHRQGSPWTNWPGVGVTIGLSCQSYHFAGTWVLLLFTFGAVAVLHRRWLTRPFRGSWKRPAAFACGLVVIMALPNAALFSESQRFVFPLRMAPADYADRPAHGGPIRWEGDRTHLSFGWWMPYDFVRYTGGSSQPWDYLQMVAPEGNPATHGNPKGGWGSPSESYLYFGLLPWFFALLGLWTGIHRKKSVALVVTFAFVLLTLGPVAGLFPILRTLYPPLWGLRNTGVLILFVELGILYFFLLGIDRVLGRHRQAPWTRGQILPTVLCAAGILGTALSFTPHGIATGIRWSWGLLIPGILGALAGARIGQPRYAVLFSVCLFLDLGTHLRESPLLTRGIPHPSATLRISTTPSKPQFPVTRHAAPDHPRAPGTPPIRYYPLLDHQAYAFTAVAKPSEGKADWERAWRGIRWNSFLLTRSYFEQIDPNGDRETLRRTLSLGEPLLQLQGGTPQVIAYSYDSLVVSLDAKTAGSLTWADGYDPNWRATVDGIPTEVSRWGANGKAIAVPAGRHRVEFRYRPWAFLLAWAAFYSAIIAAMGVSLFYGRRGIGRRYRNPDPSTDRPLSVWPESAPELPPGGASPYQT